MVTTVRTTANISDTVSTENTMVVDTVFVDVLVATALSRIVAAQPVGPARRIIAADLRRLARKHPTYRSALYRTARTLATSP